MASSEWTLRVQIQHYESINAEIRNDQVYCCCDESHACNESMQDLKSTYNCTSVCHIYFVVEVLDCNTALCFGTDTFNYSDVSRYALSSLVFQLPMVQSLPDDQVMANN